MKKNKLLSALAAAAIIAVCFALSACSRTSQLNPQGLKNCIVADTSIEYQTVEGFGASSCWWSQTVPDGSKSQIELAKALYSTDGIALSIYRYNIGGGSAELGADIYKDYKERRTETLFDASKYDKSKSAKENFGNTGNYDSTKDKNAIAFMERCVKQDNSSVKEIVLFSNSPHYLLTASGKTHGDYEYQNNLPEENYEAYSEYLIQYLYEMSVVRKLPVSAISPVNEPQHRWGGDKNSVQEGCHFDAENLAAFYNVFYRYLDSFNTRYAKNIKLSVLESGNYDTYKPAAILEYVYAMSEYDYFDKIDSLAVHSYGEPLSDEARNSFMYKLGAKWADKFSIEMSEVCHMESGLDKSMGSGLYLAQMMDKDMRLLGATSWSWWIGASGYSYNDGLVGWEFGSRDGAVDTDIKRYSVMGQYSKYLQKGDVRIDAILDNAVNSVKRDISVSAYKRSDGTLIMIVTNTGKAHRLSVAGEYKDMQVTTTDDNCDIATVYGGKFRNYVNISAKSVTTIVLK